MTEFFRNPLAAFPLEYESSSPFLIKFNRDSQPAHRHRVVSR